MAAHTAKFLSSIRKSKGFFIRPRVIITTALSLCQRSWPVSITPFQHQVTSEEPNSHEAFTALTSRTASGGDATGMTAGGNHSNEASERTKENKERARPGKRFLLWILNEHCYWWYQSSQLFVMLAASNSVFFSCSAKEGDTGAISNFVRTSGALFQSLLNPLVSTPVHHTCLARTSHLGTRRHQYAMSEIQQRLLTAAELYTVQHVKLYFSAELK